MTTIDASVLRAAWAASRPDVETYLAKCDEPARYRSWAGNAFGLRALLKAAGIRVPVDHKGDEVGGCFDWTHLHYFGFGSGAAESTLACLGYGLALFVEDCAKDAAPRDRPPRRRSLRGGLQACVPRQARRNQALSRQEGRDAGEGDRPGPERAAPPPRGRAGDGPARVRWPRRRARPPRRPRRLLRAPRRRRRPRRRAGDARVRRRRGRAGGSPPRRRSAVERRAEPAPPRRRGCA